VKCFLGLSAERAYKRFYPAVDPLISWSRYLDQLASWFDEHFGAGWINRVKEIRDLLHRGQAILQMMQVTGEEGVSMQDFVIYQKALLFDMAYLQQDAFDKVDATVPLPRQKLVFDKLYDIASRDYDFKSKEAAREYFTKLTGLFKNFHYAAENSPTYSTLLRQIDGLMPGSRP
jgi:V/A-type H+/Na+-transporting ATPase subunit A